MESADYQAMADSSRRDLLRELLTGGPVHVTSMLSDSMDQAERERQLIRLHHHHLPMLDDEGFVEWDRSADIVTRGPQFTEIQPLVALHENSSAEDTSSVASTSDRLD